MDEEIIHLLWVSLSEIGRLLCKTGRKGQTGVPSTAHLPQNRPMGSLDHDGALNYCLGKPLFLIFLLLISALATSPLLTPEWPVDSGRSTPPPPAFYPIACAIDNAAPLTICTAAT